MERNKSDKPNYALPYDLHNQQPFKLVKKTQQKGNHMQDSMFMKYASSIIEVVSEERLQKSNQFNPNEDSSDPIVEISDVMRYGDESAAASSQYQLAQSNDYNKVAHQFKKKNKLKNTLAYNFTNIATLITAVRNLFQNNSKRALELLKNCQQKKQQTDKPLRTRTSFHSGTTASTHTEQFRSRKQLDTVKKIEIQEQMKEGANAIKGWIQFKILMIQNSVLRDLMEYAKHLNYHELSPIASSKKDGLIENFFLSDYQHENSMSLAPNVHPIEESLAYTADQNFEFSRKENTITTPDKLSQEQGPYYGTRSRARQLRNPSSEGKQSLVQEYKPQYKKESMFSSKAAEVDRRVICASRPIFLKINEERRYLTIRTNLFELPVVSEHDLRKNGPSASAELPVKRDHFNPAESQFGCDNVEAITNLFECSNLFRSNGRANTNLSASQSKKSEKSQSSNSYFGSVRQKYSKVVTQQSKNSDNFIQTCMIKSTVPPRPQQQQSAKIITHQMIGAIQERKAPVKIENYYFPGRSARDTNKVPHQNQMPTIDYTSRNRLDQVKQVDSILSAYQKETVKNHYRMEESVVNTFAIKEQPKIKNVRGTAFPIRTERMPTHMQEYSQLQNNQRQRSKQQTYGLDVKNKTKINIALASNKNIQRSPPTHMQIHQLGNYNKRQEQICSPQSNHRSNPYSPSPPARPLNQQQFARPAQHQSSSNKRIEPIGRPQSRDRPIQKVNFNNVYQINQPSKIAPNTGNNPRGGYTHLGQMPQQMNRPTSRVFSPQPMPLQHQQAYALPVYRQTSAEKKNCFLSPQGRQQQYYMQPNVKFAHNQQPRLQQLSSAIAQPVHQYFETDLQGRQNQRALNYNNKYYTLGVVDRQAPAPAVMGERAVLRPKPEERRKSRIQIDRPHSSSRQSFDRPNIFSNYSPMDSELEGPNGSNPMTSRSNSKLGRPKSMNEKIHLTLRREK